MSVIDLYPEPLNRDAFAPFGEVIEARGARCYPINEGTTTRFHDLATVDVEANGGRPLISIFRAQSRCSPIPIRMLERHPLASQAFYPLSAQPYLVVVAGSATPPTPPTLRAFIASADQGVNYHRGAWHHPLLALVEDCDFLVIDRGGPGDNLEEHWFAETADTACILIPDSFCIPSP